MLNHSLNHLTLTAMAALATLPLSAQQPPIRLGEIVVSAEAENERAVQGPFLPDLLGTQITAGKKSSVIDLDALPVIVNNNYRQALATTPGLFLSEETSPLVSIGYRGLDPHRVQFSQVLKDGIPIHADQLGYPEAYYTPPLDTVDRIDFIRGGAGLMFGPQVGGALNYITHRPRADRALSGGTKNTIGSDNLFSNFTYLDGTSGRLGYYGCYNRRQGGGFRDANSWFELDAVRLKLVLDGETDSRWILALDAYEEEHGEPGGLTFAKGPGAVNYNTNRNAAARLHDLFELKRYSASLTWERDFSETTQLKTSAWATYYSRFSSRQRGGGFGILPAGPDAGSTLNEEQLFYTLGFEMRLRHDYNWLGAENSAAAGFQLYHTDSPRQERIGASPTARTGRLVYDTDREVFYAPFFAENRFKWGDFSLTPGVRVENIWQSVKEAKNAAKAKSGTPLGSSDEYEMVPLFGLGAAWEFAPGQELYANVSQSYRPKIFTQSVPTGGTTLVPGDLNSAKAVSYEAGYRGRPSGWLNWDVSLFAIDFDDQIAEIALPGGFSTVANAGRAWHQGVEAAFEADLIALLDARAGRGASQEGASGKQSKNPVTEKTLADRFGSLKLHANAMLLDAEFISGPLEGNTPRYAPDYLVRAGLTYARPGKFEVSLLGTFTGDSFGDDSNAPERAVPGYMVWDLIAEAWVYRDIVSVYAGINNLFDEDYYARVRNDGIDPAYGRNVYVGVGLRF